MNKIIGRKEEIAKFDKILNSNEAQFVAVWGRRRIGKTFLIEEFFKNTSELYMPVTGQKNATIKRQLEIFRLGIQKAFFEGMAIADFKDWNAAFAQLAACLKSVENRIKNVVIFIDELPWLDTHKSGLVSALDYYWNTELKNFKFLRLIVCGSAASWIIKKIVNSKGGLHNRLTDKISLQPFTLQETEDFLLSKDIKLDRKQILELYLCIGGVPFYLNMINKGESAEQAVSRLCFGKGYLTNEFDTIFDALFKESIHHTKIISILSTKRKGVFRSELSHLTKIEGGQLTIYLSELEQSGFIQGYREYLGKSDEKIYRIIDPFTLFYFKWMRNFNELEIKSLGDDNSKTWQLNKSTQIYSIWAGYSYENICYLHANKIKKALGLESTKCLSSTWTYIPKTNKQKGRGTTKSPDVLFDGKEPNLALNGAQIDLLFDRNDGVISLCEIKYYTTPFIVTKEISQEVSKKVEIFKQISKTKKNIFMVLIANEEPKNTIELRKTFQNVLALDDLF